MKKYKTLTETVQLPPLIGLRHKTQLPPDYASKGIAYFGIWDTIVLDKRNGIVIDIGKSTENTFIIKEEIGPINNTYIHHIYGDGRETTKIRPFDEIKSPNAIPIWVSHLNGREEKNGRL